MTKHTSKMNEIEQLARDMQEALLDERFKLRRKLDALQRSKERTKK